MIVAKLAPADLKGASGRWFSRGGVTSGDANFREDGQSVCEVRMVGAELGFEQLARLLSEGDGGCDFTLCSFQECDRGETATDIGVVDGAGLAIDVQGALGTTFGFGKVAAGTVVPAKVVPDDGNGIGRFAVMGLVNRKGAFVQGTGFIPSTGDAIQLGEVVANDRHARVIGAVVCFANGECLPVGLLGVLFAPER